MQLAAPAKVMPSVEGAAVSLRFPGLAQEIVLNGAEQVESALNQVLTGWNPTRSQSLENDAPLSCVVPGRDGYDLSSIYLDSPMRDLPAASTACGILADLGEAFFDQRPGCLCLHCGAISINGRLIALTGQKRAGKSTLVSRLTAEPDIQVWCDDMLPILDDGLAFGLGIAPRLRLPLPPTASARFRDHVAAWIGPHDDRYGYVCAPTVAPHGTRALLLALIALDRRTDGPARLHRLSPDAAVHHLLSQNMADLQAPEAAFDRMNAMADQMICLQLVYSDLEDAVALLRRAFGGDELLDPTLALGDELPIPTRASAQAPSVDPARRWQRANDVALRRRGASSFLWRPGAPMIWQLNPVAGAVWTLLEIPGSAEEIAATLSEVYLEVSPAQLTGDVAALLGAMVADDLVLPAV
jgi:hypothetical protein